MVHKGKLFRGSAMMLFFFFVIFVAGNTQSVQGTSTFQGEIKEAEKVIGNFLRNEAGTKWLSDLAKTRSSPITTTELMNEILRSSPEGGKVWRAARKLSDALQNKKLADGSRYDSSTLQSDNWKDLIANIELEDDIICLYRKSSNETTKKQEDWKKFLKTVSPGYTVHLAIDTGRKYVICLKKIQIPETTTLPPTTTALPVLARSETKPKEVSSTSQKTTLQDEELTSNEGASVEMCKDKMANRMNNAYNEDLDDEDYDDDEIFWKKQKKRSHNCESDCNKPIVIVLPSQEHLLPNYRSSMQSPYWNSQFQIYQPSRMSYPFVTSSPKPELRYALPNYKPIKFRAEDPKLPETSKNIPRRTSSRTKELSDDLDRPSLYQSRKISPASPLAMRVPMNIRRERVEYRTPGVLRKIQKKDDIKGGRRGLLPELPGFILHPSLINRPSDYNLLRMTSRGRPWQERFVISRPWSGQYNVPFKSVYHTMRSLPNPNPFYVKNASSAQQPTPTQRSLKNLYPPFTRPVGVSLEPNPPKLYDQSSSSRIPIVLAPKFQYGGRPIVTGSRIGHFHPLFSSPRYQVPVNYYPDRLRMRRPTYLPNMMNYYGNPCNRLNPICPSVVPIQGKHFPSYVPIGGSSDCNGPLNLKVFVNGHLHEPVKIVAGAGGNFRTIGSGRRSIADPFSSREDAELFEAALLNGSSDKDMIAEELSHERSDFETEDSKESHDISEEARINGLLPADRSFSELNDPTTQSSTIPETSTHRESLSTSPTTTTK